MAACAFQTVSRILGLWALVLMAPLSIAPAAEKILRVSYSAPATAYLPLWAAKEAGFFERNNLKIELLYVGSSPIALSALLADEIDVLAGGGTAGPTACLRGLRDLALFSTLDHRLPFKVYAVPVWICGESLQISGGSSDPAVRIRRCLSHRTNLSPSS